MYEKNRRLRNARRVFNKRIVIEKPTVSTDAFSQQKQVFKSFKHLYAEVKNLYGKEYFAAKQVNAEKTVKFTIRYADGHDITERMRIVMDDSIYNIVFIDNIDYLNELIEIKAVKTGDCDEH